MEGFTTTADGWEFRLGGEKPKEAPPPEIDFGMQVKLAYPEKWAFYCDEETYDFEKRLLAWGELKTCDVKWSMRNGRNRRYTMKMLWEELYDDPMPLGGSVKKFAKVAAYYSSRVQTGASINGTKITKTVYVISSKRISDVIHGKLHAYSFKLRMELQKPDDPLAWVNWTIPKDLKRGHARNYRTEKHMMERREAGRNAYNQRYKDRSH